MKASFEGREALPSPPKLSEPGRETGEREQRIEASLRESAQRLRIALESGKLGSWQLDVVAGEFLEISDRCKANFGLPPDAPFTYATLLSTIHPDDRDAVRAAVERALETGEDYQAEYRCLWPDSSVHWIAAQGHLFYDDRGRPTRMIGVTQEITERKQAEQALRQAEERYRSLLIASSDIIWTTDAEGRVADIPAWRAFTGQSEAEVRGAGWLAALHPDDRARAAQTWAEAVARRGVYEIEYRVRRRDGAFRTFAVKGIPVLEEDGTIREWVGACTDITERGESQQRLASAYRREVLINRLGEAIRRTLDPDHIQATAVLALCEALRSDRCLFALVDAPRESLRIVQEWHRADLKPLARQRDMACLAARIAAPLGEGKTRAVEDVQNVQISPWPPEVAAVLARLRMRALLVVPFFDRGRLFAVLAVSMADAPRAWTPDEVSLAEAIAAQTRTAVEAARVVQREKAIADQLQAALQPALPPSVPGLSLKEFYKPALDEAGVGGDFYDVFARENNRSALIVGDVSGKGLAAAAQVATLRNMLRYALYNEPSLARALTVLNRTLITHDLLQGFATLFAGVYDSAARTLTYVSCGQEPALLRRAATGAVEELPPTAPVLGALENAVFSEHTVALSPGDALAIFTDGFTEAGPTREQMLGVSGVAALLARHAPEETATHLATRLARQVSAFAQNDFRDDVCLLVALVRPDSA